MMVFLLWPFAIKMVLIRNNNSVEKIESEQSSQKGYVQKPNG